MDFIRKAITTVTVVALGAPALTAFAMSPSEGYGRAGGSIAINSGTVRSESSDKAGEQTPPSNLYGRAGGMTGSDKVGHESNWPAASEPLTAVPTFPGRQGHVLTIDEVRS